MAFPKNAADKALIACGRYCCICHKFCGTKMELHHIEQRAEGGADTFDNCIPLCFDCHADVGSYNHKHPKGRKYSVSELMGHRDNWYAKVEQLFSVQMEQGENRKSSKQELYIWCPEKPLTNNNTTHIENHPVDYRVDIENHRITGNANEPETMATREVALMKHMYHYVLTIRGKHTIYPSDYGSEEAVSIFMINDNTEFQRQAANLAESMMAHENFKDWIQKLYSVSRDGSTLIIDFKVNGLPETLKCKIPKPNTEDYSKREPFKTKNEQKRNEESMKMTKLNSVLEGILEKAVVGASNNYFDYVAADNNGTKQHLDDLARLGYIRRVSDWNLWFHDNDLASKATFQLLSPAYTYNEDSALQERQSDQKATISVYGNMSNSQIQQFTEISTQTMVEKEIIDFNNALELFGNAIDNLETFSLTKDDKEQ